MKRPNRGGINICRKDFAMGKGKSIYSATVLGNGRGERARGGGMRLRERFSPIYKANRQNKEHEMERGAGLQSVRRLIFKKENSLSVSSTEGHVFKKKEKKKKREIENSKAIRTHDKAN